MQNVNDPTPHYWVPSWQHMGDCAVCGHMRESDIHLNDKPEKPTDALERMFTEMGVRVVDVTPKQPT